MELNNRFSNKTIIHTFTSFILVVSSSYSLLIATSFICNSVLPSVTHFAVLSLQQAAPLMRTQTLACVNTDRAKRMTLTGSWSGPTIGYIRPQIFYEVGNWLRFSDGSDHNTVVGLSRKIHFYTQASDQYVTVVYGLLTIAYSGIIHTCCSGASHLD